MGGYSIYASSLDGSDKCVCDWKRIWLMNTVAKDGWKIEKMLCER